MAFESVDVLLNRPDSLIEAIMDQWVIDGGERAQRSTDAVLALVYALRVREIGRVAARTAREVSSSPRGRRVGDGAPADGSGPPAKPLGPPPLVVESAQSPA
eukprot:8878478-Alexandrium_andersonii.AAC.1